MENKTLLLYLQWADNQIFYTLAQQLASQTKDTLSQIKNKLLHLAEEYRAWLCDIQDIGPKEYVIPYESMTSEELISEIQQLHHLWIDYLDRHKMNEVYNIDEESFTVSITLDEVIYNLANHASYHRGQIALLLRLLDITTPITDFYWYKIYNLQNQ